jgi:hypothetical protein
MEAGMETFEVTRTGGETGPPPVRGDASAGAEEHAPKPWSRPSPHLRSTRGGSGSAAGSTPKKAYRPSASKRPRPAGKKADSGLH